jgi:hypothetical protein
MIKTFWIISLVGILIAQFYQSKEGRNVARANNIMDPPRVTTFSQSELENFDDPEARAEVAKGISTLSPRELENINVFQTPNQATSSPSIIQGATILLDKFKTTSTSTTSTSTTSTSTTSKSTTSTSTTSTSTTSKSTTSTSTTSKSITSSSSTSTSTTSTSTSTTSTTTTLSTFLSQTEFEIGTEINMDKSTTSVNEYDNGNSSDGNDDSDNNEGENEEEGNDEIKFRRPSVTSENFLYLWNEKEQRYEAYPLLKKTVATTTTLSLPPATTTTLSSTTSTTSTSTTSSSTTTTSTTSTTSITTTTSTTTSTTSSIQKTKSRPTEEPDFDKIVGINIENMAEIPPSFAETPKEGSFSLKLDLLNFVDRTEMAIKKIFTFLKYEREGNPHFTSDFSEYGEFFYLILMPLLSHARANYQCMSRKSTLYEIFNIRQLEALNFLRNKDGVKIQSLIPSGAETRIWLDVEIDVDGKLNFPSGEPILTFMGINKKNAIVPSNLADGECVYFDLKKFNYGTASCNDKALTICYVKKSAQIMQDRLFRETINDKIADLTNLRLSKRAKVILRNKTDLISEGNCSEIESKTFSLIEAMALKEPVEIFAKRLYIDKNIYSNEYPSLVKDIDNFKRLLYADNFEVAIKSLLGIAVDIKLTRDAKSIYICFDTKIKVPLTPTPVIPVEAES